MTLFQIEDLPIESQMLTNALNDAQRKVEDYFFGSHPLDLVSFANCQALS